jgi:phosphatidylserine decarboxylase
MTIHREGYWPLVITVVVLTVLNVLFFTFLPTNSWPKIIMIASVILFLLILQFFRNPKIITELDPNKVYAPADGKVVVIEQTLETEYLNEPRIQVSIFMSPLNVHINRNPAP